MISKLMLSYLAGVIDSDGFITIKKSTYNIRTLKDSHNPTYSERIGIKQIKPEAIKIIHKHFGGYYRIEKPTATNGNPLYAVEIRNQKAIKFLAGIYPYLRIKKKQAQILLKLRKLNDRGKTEVHFIQQKNRWGKIQQFKKYRVSAKDIQKKENLLQEIKSLNDSRSHEIFKPLPY